MSAVRHTSIWLMALVVMAASACLCAVSYAGEAPSAHAHHAMAIADDASSPQPCEMGGDPCHVVAKADKAKAAPALMPPAIIVVALPQPAFMQMQDISHAFVRAVHPPPSPVSRRDISLT